MNSTSASRFVERAVTIHRYDCTAAPVSTLYCDAIAEDVVTTGGIPDDAIVCYAVATRPVYDGLRRSIGQLAGLLVLVAAGGRRDVLDLPELAIARDRWHELENQLTGVAVPRGLDRHFSRLQRAHALTGEVLDGFDAARDEGNWQVRIDCAAETIKTAYACLQAASEPRAGMTMVDFNHACCSCAQRWRQEGGSNGPIFNLGA